MWPTVRRCSQRRLWTPMTLFRYERKPYIFGNHEIFNDSPQWPNSKKVMILVVCALYSFLGNSALIGVSPYFALWSEIFGITETQASNLISYPNLCYGFGEYSRLPWSTNLT